MNSAAQQGIQAGGLLLVTRTACMGGELWTAGLYELAVQYERGVAGDW